MYHVSTVPLSELNQHFICGLCFGYIVDATTIIECPHSCELIATNNAFCPASHEYACCLYSSASLSLVSWSR